MSLEERRYGLLELLGLVLRSRRQDIGCHLLVEGTAAVDPEKHHGHHLLDGAEVGDLEAVEDPQHEGQDRSHDDHADDATPLHLTRTMTPVVDEVVERSEHLEDGILLDFDQPADPPRFVIRGKVIGVQGHL